MAKDEIDDLGFHNLTIAEKKPPAKDSSFVDTCELLSSFVEIHIAEGSKAYRYDVSIESNGKALTKGPPDDGHGAMRRNVCFDLLYAAIKKTNGFGTGLGYSLPLAYNRQNLIYFSHPLTEDFMKVELNEDRDFEDVTQELYYMVNSIDTVIVTISRVDGEDGCLDLYNSIFNVAPIDADSISSRDRSFRTFLELVTSAKALFERSYVAVGPSLFETEHKTRDMKQGKCMRQGIKKGVCVVEKAGIPYPALVVDCKTAAFFKKQLLLKSIAEVCGGRLPPNSVDSAWNIIAKLYRDVRVHVIAEASRGPKARKSFPILRFTERSAHEQRVSNRETVVQYFERLGLKLKYPHLRCVEVDSKPCKYYPVEFLAVAGNQIVPLEKADTLHSKALLEANSVKPAERLQRIKAQLVQLHLCDSKNSFLSAFGISLSDDFIKITAGVRIAPRIEVAGGETIRVNPDKAKWNMSNKQYVSTAPIVDWAVLCNFRNDRSRVGRPMIEAFIQRLVNVARRRGVHIEDPRILDFNGDFRTAFPELQKDHRQFVLYLSPLAEKKHDQLKLCEREFNLLTQHVCLERVETVMSRNNITILDNIVHKTNMKLGGLNVIPRIEPLGERMEMESGEFLVIAYDVCHPAPMTSRERCLVRSMKGSDVRMTSLDPSVVGIVANCVAHPHAFIGDYHYQVARKEALDENLLSIRTKWIFDMLQRHRPDKARPRHIIILRDGVSEGQYSMTLNEELEAIREAVRNVDPNYKPTFTLVIATKRHHKRFFDAQGRLVANTKPGTVIDRDVVRGDVTEFFLQSHFPILGTVKIPQYAVLCDEANFSSDELQAFVNCMCHSHQIIDSAVSIPEPIYAADEIAKRGKNNLAELRKTQPTRIPRLPSGLVDCEELTELLSYWNTDMHGIRFNA